MMGAKLRSRKRQLKCFLLLTHSSDLQSTVSQLELKLEGIKHFLAQETEGMPKVMNKSVPYQASLCMLLHGMQIIIPSQDPASCQSRWPASFGATLQLQSVLRAAEAHHTELTFVADNLPQFLPGPSSRPSGEP